MASAVTSHGRARVKRDGVAHMALGSNNTVVRRVFDGTPLTPELFQGLLEYPVDSEWLLCHLLPMRHELCVL